MLWFISSSQEHNVTRWHNNHISKRVFFVFFGCLICFVGVTLNIIWRVLVASLHYAQTKTSYVATILRLLSCRISDDLNQTFEDMINMSVWRTHPVGTFTFGDVFTLQMVFYEKKIHWFWDIFYEETVFLTICSVPTFAMSCIFRAI